MNANDTNGREGREGERKKGKMTFNQELPQQRIKEAPSIQDLAKAIFTPAVVQELSSSSSPQTSPDLLHQTPFSASHFSGAHDFVSNGGTFNNILGNYIFVSRSSDADSQTRSSKGIIEGFPVLSVEDISIEREIYKGRGYRLHAAKTSGKIVAMKVYQGSRARERCSEVARFNQKAIHPNIPQIIGVSPLKSDLSYLIFEGEYEGAVHDILDQALKKDLKQILTLGLQTVAGLSSGLDYLQDLKYPFASLGLDHFVILSHKGKPVISFDPDDLSPINQSNHQFCVSSSAEVIFHQLCTRTFDSACKAHYENQQIQRGYTDEFDTDVNDLPENRFEELDSNGLTSSSKGPSPRTSPGKPLPSGRRQELVWKAPTGEAVSLHDISHQFQNFLNASLLSSEPAVNRRRGRYAPRTAHRCPGYNRIEITLTANITRSAIVSHSSPIPHEICPVCKEVVKGTDVFNCICGSNDDESMPTVQCTSCFEWHHWRCITSLDVEPLITFVCKRCEERSIKQIFPSQHTHPLTFNEDVPPIYASFLSLDPFTPSRNNFYGSPLADANLELRLMDWSDERFSWDVNLPGSLLLVTLEPSHTLAYDDRNNDEIFNDILCWQDNDVPLFPHVSEDSFFETLRRDDDHSTSSSGVGRFSRSEPGPATLDDLPPSTHLSNSLSTGSKIKHSLAHLKIRSLTSVFTHFWAYTNSSFTTDDADSDGPSSALWDRLKLPPTPNGRPISLFPVGGTEYPLSPLSPDVFCNTSTT